MMDSLVPVWFIFKVFLLTSTHSKSMTCYGEIQSHICPPGGKESGTINLIRHEFNAYLPTLTDLP